MNLDLKVSELFFQEYHSFFSEALEVRQDFVANRPVHAYQASE
jgi:hypothetical protein